MIGLTADEQVRLRDAALSWDGTPFHPKAAKKGVGVGCIELLVASYQEAGLLDRIHLAYPWGFWQHKSDEEFLADLMREFAIVAPPWQIGDGLTFRGRPWPGTGHTALCIGDGEVVHAVANRTVQRWPIRGTILHRTLHQGWRLRRG
jgi:hypothetical protein